MWNVTISTLRNRRGRADALLVIGALACTGLVAAGVTYLLSSGDAGSRGLAPIGEPGTASYVSTPRDGTAQESATGKHGATSKSDLAAKQDRPGYSAQGNGAGEASKVDGNGVTRAGQWTGSPADEAKKQAILDAQKQSQARADGQGAQPAFVSTPGATADQMRKREGAIGKGVNQPGLGQGSPARARTFADGSGTTTTSGNQATGNQASSNQPGVFSGNGVNGGNRGYGANGGMAAPEGQLGTGAFTADNGGAQSQNPTGANPTGANPPAPGTEYDSDGNPLIPYVDPIPEEPVVPAPEPEFEEPEVQVSGGAYMQVPEGLQVGQTVSLPLLIDTGGRYLAAYGLELAWDNTLISVDSVDPGNGDFDAPFVINLENDQGRLRFNGISINPRAHGQVNVANLRVTVHARPASGVATIRPLSSNQTIAVYADDGRTPLTVPNAAFATAQLRINQ